MKWPYRLDVNPLVTTVDYKVNLTLNLLCMLPLDNHTDIHGISLSDVGATGFMADLVEIGDNYLGFFLPQKYTPVCPDELLDDMFHMGTFGNSSGADRTAGRIVADTVQSGEINDGKMTSYFRLLFPSYKTWCAWKPYLADKPWMVVPEWCWRIGRYLRGETSTSDIKGLDRAIRLLLTE